MGLNKRFDAIIPEFVPTLKTIGEKTSVNIRGLPSAQPGVFHKEKSG
jgi:hypothetical protein